MKIRSGFVSNSSSSSFLCDACGERFTEYECYPETACEIGHSFCEYCSPDKQLILKDLMKDPEVARKMIIEKDKWLGENVEPLDLSSQENLEYLENYLSDIFTDAIPTENCPICKLEIITQYDLASYLHFISGITKESIFAEVKAQNKRRRKLYDYEYNMIVLGKIGRTLEDIQAEMRSKAKTLNELENLIYPEGKNEN